MIRLAAIFVILASGAVAQTAADQLRDARAQLTQAQSASDRIAALTRTVQAYEAGLAALRAEQRETDLYANDLSQQLAADRAEMADMLGALSNISKTPQPVQRAHPSGPVENMRAGMLVAAMVPALEAEVSEMTAALAEARRVKMAQDQMVQTLTEGLQGVQSARAALGQAVSERTDLPARFVDDPVQTAVLVASAETLDSFAAELATVRPDPQQTLTPQANLALPVSGIILPDDGSGRAGLRIGAAQRAIVTAPAPATVLFQGPLLDYRTVVILEPATDILFVMSGLDEMFVQTGEIVPAGAPIGLLGTVPRDDDRILTENMGLEPGQYDQTLYLEVRDGQGPTNIDAWFALE